MDPAVAEMQALAIKAHSHQQRNAGRVPYAAHVLSVGEIVKEALALSGECSEPELALDVYLAAVGHDLYEDTDVTPDDIRKRFGPRVDSLIEALTNRQGDQDRAAYEANMSLAREEVRLIKLADLVDNVFSCAYGIHDLGRTWIVGSFLPIAEGMSKTVKAARYTRFKETAKRLLDALDLALARLRANLAIVDLLEASSGVDPRARSRAALAAFDGKLTLDPDAEDERVRREGWLVRGMRAFGDE